MSATTAPEIDATFDQLVGGIAIPQPRRPRAGRGRDGEWTIWAQHSRRQARRAAR